jgi:peptidoglycan/LPS O-acetylase OafA/YrhL
LRSIRFSAISVRSGKNGEFRMTWAIRSYALAAGAAALLSAQAVYAAPTPTASSGIDPLVSLSVLGSQQSRAALCSASASATACSVPASIASAAAAAAAATAAQDQPAPKSFGIWPILLGLAALAAVIVAITSGGNNGSGDLSPIGPVSPA